MVLFPLSQTWFTDYIYKLLYRLLLFPSSSINLVRPLVRLRHKVLSACPPDSGWSYYTMLNSAFISLPKLLLHLRIPHSKPCWYYNNLQDLTKVLEFVGAFWPNSFLTSFIMSNVGACPLYSWCQLILVMTLAHTSFPWFLFVLSLSSLCPLAFEAVKPQPSRLGPSRLWAWQPSVITWDDLTAHYSAACQ